MNDHERCAARAETRREERGEALLARYIGAVATVSARHATVRLAAVPAEAPADGTPEAGPEPLLVRDVMDLPTASVRGNLPFLDVARLLTREHTGCLPVVDPEDHVLGVVSESDLLAKAAIEASGGPSGVLARFRERRPHGNAHAGTAGTAGTAETAETAETLMTSPAVTVYSRQTVAEAAWLVSLARLKRLPVTDQAGRLIGVVHRNALLGALLRNDETDPTGGACPTAPKDHLDDA
ncbi:CBS domain-containing protein [Streptomyces cavernicola]|uniref:CBS domain-containing protein n=1 Tax=Streptomyces cavernicola TaxID=3043613 RepID=A0ABT6SFB7_9ACTN|nr:CBS domain-containing protein [Streptomyces sp. B-S-A6]MDI3406855.1 CBS domain-containing protein [Streptomyces sp. B-S-A6]